ELQHADLQVVAGEPVDHRDGEHQDHRRCNGNGGTVVAEEVRALGGRTRHLLGVAHGEAIVRRFAGAGRPYFAFFTSSSTGAWSPAPSEGSCAWATSVP